MKKAGLYPFLLLLGMSLLIASCGSDDDDSNSFTFDGMTYSLTTGVIEYYGENFDGSHDYDVTLLGDGFSIGNSEVSGTGDLVYLDLNTSSNGGLESGTYSWSANRAPLTIVSGSAAALNFNTETLTGTPITITGGSITVDVNGAEVTITMSLEAGSQLLTGTYTGPLQDI